jgi:hypothetical protein
MIPEAKAALARMSAELEALDDRMGKELSGGRVLDNETAGQILLAMASAHLVAASHLATMVLGPAGAAQLFYGEADKLAAPDGRS